MENMGNRNQANENMGSLLCESILLFARTDIAVHSNIPLEEMVTLIRKDPTDRMM